MGEGVRHHTRRCAICDRTVHIANLSRRSHFIEPVPGNRGGYAQTDTHALSHLTKEEKAVWWTLPASKWNVHLKSQTKDY